MTLPALKYEVSFSKSWIAIWQHASHVVLSWDYPWLKLVKSWHKQESTQKHMTLIEIQDLADRFERTPFSEIDRAIPRMAKPIAVIKLNEEQRRIICKALRYFIGHDLNSGENK